MKWAPGEGALRCCRARAVCGGAGAGVTGWYVVCAEHRAAAAAGHGTTSSSSLLTRPPGALLQSVCVRGASVSVSFSASSLLSVFVDFFSQVT